MYVGFQFELWAPISFILDVEELHWEIAWQVDHCTVVKHYVEILSLVSTVALKEEVFRIGFFIEGALEIGVFAVHLEIPRKNKVPLVNVVEYEDLNEVIDASWVDVLNPHFRSKVDR